MTANSSIEVKTASYISNIKDSIANAKVQIKMLNGEILDVPEPFITDNLLCTNDDIFMRGQDTANYIAEKQAELSQLESFQAATAGAAVSETIQHSDPHFTIDAPPPPPYVGICGGNYQVRINAVERDSEGNRVTVVSVLKNFNVGTYRKLEAARRVAEQVDSIPE